VGWCLATAAMILRSFSSASHDAPDERDPLGVNRKAALKALAYQFLNPAGRKQIAVVVRLKEHQSADFRAIYGILAQCFDTQLDQVFGSLDESERAEAAAAGTADCQPLSGILRPTQY